MVRIRVEVLDSRGRVSGSLTSLDGNVIAVTGPIIGAHGFAYNQRGTVLDKEGELSFTVPLTIARNDVLAAGNHVKIYEDGTEMGEYVITTSSENLSANGREAQLVCPDLMDELRRITVSSGFNADIGHVSTGASDPIPARPPETLLSTAARALAIRYAMTGDTATAWGVGEHSTAPTNLDGLAFGVGGVSIVETIGKLCNERFMHFKLGAGRSVAIGRFGQASGIRLIKGTHTPWATSGNAEVREIVSFQRQWDGNFVNDIVPRGTGSDSQQLTLKSLYDFQHGSVPAGTAAFVFVGYDPRFPIKKRLRYDQGGADGYDYYIDTLNFNDSIARYGLSQNVYDQPSIGPTTPITPFSILQAAASLYQAAIAHLQWYYQPHEVFTIVTEGRGDLRDIAGKTVRVVYREINADGATVRDINKDYFVMEAKRAWDDSGVAQDTWTVSNGGTYLQDGFQVFTGALQQLDYFRTMPTIFPTRESIYYDALVDSIHPATIMLDQDNSVVGITEATFTVTCLPAVAPITSTAQSSTAGAHFHNIIGSLPTSGTTAGNVDHSATGGQYGHGHGSGTAQGIHSTTFDNGNANHTHGSSFSGSKTGSVSGAQLSGVPDHYHNVGVQGNRAAPGLNYAVWVDSNSNFVVGSGPTVVGTDVPHYAPNFLAATNHGHGDTIGVSASGGVSKTSGFDPTSDQYNGFAPSVDQGATAASGGGFTPSINSHGVIGVSGSSNPFGNISTAYTTSTDGAHWHAMSYGYYQDPAGAASGVTIQVNSVRVDSQFVQSVNGYAPGPYNGTFIVDLNVLGVIPAQGGVRVDFYSATFGRLLIRGRIRRLETTVAAHT